MVVSVPSTQYSVPSTQYPYSGDHILFPHFLFLLLSASGYGILIPKSILRARWPTASNNSAKIRSISSHLPTKAFGCNPIANLGPLGMNFRSGPFES